MNNSRFCLGALTAGTMLIGCSKPDIPLLCDCQPLVLKQSWTGNYPTKGPDLNYARPSFNPVNGQEIAYLKGARAEGQPSPAQVSGLWVYDQATRVQRQVRAGYDMFLGLNWSATGWIAMSKDNQIWKIKSSGDSLTQLTFGRAHYAPQWSPDGQRLVCRDGDDANGAQVIINKNGRELDRFFEPQMGYCQAWSPDGRKLAVIYGSEANYGVGVYDLISRQLTKVAPSLQADNLMSSLAGAAWLPDSQTLIWCSSEGIFKTNTVTQQTQRLQSGCTSRIYLYPSIAPDSRSLVVERIDLKAVDDGNTIFRDGGLWTMNLDGSQQRKLPL